MPEGLLTRVLAAAALAGGTGGCAFVTPPKTVPDPVAVYVTDYGIHSSLLLPVNDREYVEYSFGDYGYAAENHDSILHAIAALFISFQAGFGRHYLAVRPGYADPAVYYVPLNVQKFYVSQAKVQALIAQMDARFARGGGPTRYNPQTMVTWVRDREHYSLLNNCNQLSAHCMRELGCTVPRPVVLSHFKVIGGTVLDPKRLNPKEEPPIKAQ